MKKAMVLGAAYATNPEHLALAAAIVLGVSVEELVKISETEDGEFYAVKGKEKEMIFSTANLKLFTEMRNVDGAGIRKEFKGIIL